MRRRSSESQVLGGRYRLLARLGQGGTGAVYQAADLLLGRVVAVKALHSHFDVELLRREGRSLAQLNHPHVVALYDSIEEHGKPYLVMEYVDGCDLQKRLREGPPFTSRQALLVFQQVADAVRAAHAVGVLHCDVKPANVLLGADGTVKLTDFTLARAVSGSSMQGTMGGTLPYAAPEQIRGEPVDVRADVYALGMLLQVLIPQPDLSIRALVERATQGDRDHRFPSVGELLMALPTLDTKLTHISAHSTQGQHTRIQPMTFERHRPSPWAGLAVLVAASALAGGAAFSHFTAQASPSRITLPSLVATQRQSAEVVLHSLSLRSRVIWTYSSSAASGMVMAQRPAGGTLLAPHGLVSMTISRGPQPIAVPDVQHLSVDDAVLRLKGRHLRVTIQTDDQLFDSPGTVLGQTPTVGRTLPPGGSVTLTVSKKPWWWPLP